MPFPRRTPTFVLLVLAGLVLAQAASADPAVVVFGASSEGTAQQFVTEGRFCTWWYPQQESLPATASPADLVSVYSDRLRRPAIFHTVGPCTAEPQRIDWVVDIARSYVWAVTNQMGRYDLRSVPNVLPLIAPMVSEQNRAQFFARALSGSPPRVDAVPPCTDHCRDFHRQLLATAAPRLIHNLNVLLGSTGESFLSAAVEAWNGGSASLRLAATAPLQGYCATNLTLAATRDARGLPQDWRLACTPVAGGDPVPLDPSRSIQLLIPRNCPNAQYQAQGTDLVTLQGPGTRTAAVVYADNVHGVTFTGDDCSSDNEGYTVTRVANELAVRVPEDAPTSDSVCMPRAVLTPLVTPTAVFTWQIDPQTAQQRLTAATVALRLRVRPRVYFYLAYTGDPLDAQCEIGRGSDAHANGDPIRYDCQHLRANFTEQDLLQRFLLMSPVALCPSH